MAGWSTSPAALSTGSLSTPRSHCLIDSWDCLTALRSVTISPPFASTFTKHAHAFGMAGGILPYAVLTQGFCCSSIRGTVAFAHELPRLDHRWLRDSGLRIMRGRGQRHRNRWPSASGASLHPEWCDRPVDRNSTGEGDGTQVCRTVEIMVLGGTCEGKPGCW